MNDALQKWITAIAKKPGTLGGGILLPDGSSVCQSADDKFPLERIGILLKQLAASQPQLSGADLEPRWSTWVFDEGRIRCVFRPDGLLLGLAVRNDTEAAHGLDPAAAEFLKLESRA